MYHKELHRWSVGVLYLNLGLAVLNFPTTTRAHPSFHVQVALAPRELLQDDHRTYFPFSVRWDIWERVIVPLFADGSALVKVHAATNETLRQWINREYLETRNHDALLAKIQQMLLAGLEASGYVPPGTVVSSLA